MNLIFQFTLPYLGCPHVASSMRWWDAKPFHLLIVYAPDFKRHFAVLILNSIRSLFHWHWQIADLKLYQINHLHCNLVKTDLLLH